MGPALLRLMMNSLQVASIIIIFFTVKWEAGSSTASEEGGSRREDLKRPGKFAVVLEGTRWRSSLGDWGQCWG